MQIDEDIAKIYGLSEEDIQLTMSGYVPMNLKTNDYFLREGQVSNYIAYVGSGLLRSFFYDDNANEITTQFYPEGSLIISFDSFNNRLPSREYIMACVDSELMATSYDNQKKLYDQIPAWNQICKDLADHKSKEMQARAAEFQTMSAFERYRKFCNDYPQVIRQAKLGHIASYIGVDIATLSRIRKKK